MKLKKLTQIDYSLYSSTVVLFTTALFSFLLLLFAFLGWETEKYPIGRMLALSYIFLFFTIIYIISIVFRFFRISNILKEGIDDKAEIIKKVKVKNDNIKLYLKATEQSFICSLRRNKKNKNLLDNKFKEGDIVDIKHYRNKALLTKYYI